jgi:hypothetical protein
MISLRWTTLGTIGPAKPGGAFRDVTLPISCTLIADNDRLIVRRARQGAKVGGPGSRSRSMWDPMAAARSETGHHRIDLLPAREGMDSMKPVTKATLSLRLPVGVMAARACLGALEPLARKWSSMTWPPLSRKGASINNMYISAYWRG